MEGGQIFKAISFKSKLKYPFLREAFPDSPPRAPSTLVYITEPFSLPFSHLKKNKPDITVEVSLTGARMLWLKS